MNYNEAIEYIHSVSNFFCKPGLERIEKLCEMLGNPQNKLKFIHVAGTNGKGSFCAMLSSILSTSGYKTGLYTSPYITRFNERIMIDGNMISDNDLADLTTYVKQFAEKLYDKPTEFEIITAIAFEYFYRCGCDYVVLECGLGGRFDATNIVSTSILSIITGISVDHTNFLGNTISEIAKEKAGIIKSKVPCLWCGDDKTALSVIENCAKTLCAPLFYPYKEKLNVISYTLNGTYFDYDEYKNMFVNLLGTFQPFNAINVISATKILNSLGISISEDNIRKGLERVIWHARFEILCHNPLFIYDGGHNYEGAAAAVNSIKHYFGNKKVIVINGIMKDKDYDLITKIISEIAEKVFCITPNNPRALSSHKLCDIYQNSGVEAERFESIDKAVESAISLSLKKSIPIICLGSLYMYQDVRDSIFKYSEKKV